MENKEKLEKSIEKEQTESIFVSLLHKVFEKKGKINDVEAEVSGILNPLDLFIVNKKYFIDTVKLIQYMKKEKGDHSKREIQEGAGVPLIFVNDVIDNAGLLKQKRKVGGALMYEIADKFKKF